MSAGNLVLLVVVATILSSSFRILKVKRDESQNNSEQDNKRKKKGHGFPESQQSVQSTQLSRTLSNQSSKDAVAELTYFFSTGAAISTDFSALLASLMSG